LCDTIRLKHTINMPHRIKKRQLSHDEKVREVALRLRRQGYFVRADLPGHPRPPRVGGIRPDIYAHKKGKKLIYEIETKESMETDQPQREKLEKASKKIGAEFRVLTT